MTDTSIDFESLSFHSRQMLELTDNNQNVDTPKCRVFYTNDNRAIFAVQLLETTDSFLVGAAARMVKANPDSDVVVDPLYRSQVIRLYKSNLAASTFIPEEYVFLYIDYLLNEGSKSLPDYMTGTRVEGCITILNAISEQTLGIPVKNSSKTGKTPSIMINDEGAEVWIH